MGVSGKGNGISLVLSRESATRRRSQETKWNWVEFVRYALDLGAEPLGLGAQSPNPECRAFIVIIEETLQNALDLPMVMIQ